MTGGVKGRQARTLQMKPSAGGVCRSLVWPPTSSTSHPYCPEGTQRLLSNSSGQRFGQTRQTAAAGLSLAEGVTDEQRGDKEFSDSLSSPTDSYLTVERKEKKKTYAFSLTCCLEMQFEQKRVWTAFTGSTSWKLHSCSSELHSKSQFNHYCKNYKPRSDYKKPEFKGTNGEK